MLPIPHATLYRALADVLLGVTVAAAFGIGLLLAGAVGGWL